VYNELFSDLKELDKRLKKIDELLDCSAVLFRDYYSENAPGYTGNFSWPYSVKGPNAEPQWPSYKKDLPNTPRLSAITSAMCGWAVSEYLSVHRPADEKLRKIARQVAQKLAMLSPENIKSVTFTGENVVFVQMQVLRLLASQAEWKGALFSQLYGAARDLAGASTNTPPTLRLHSFFLHYCVLALEEVRRRSDHLSDAVFRLSQHADKLNRFEVNSWPDKVVLLEYTEQLRELLESLATIIRIDFLRPDLAAQCDRTAETVEELCDGIASALMENPPDAARGHLSKLKVALQDCIGGVREAMRYVPGETSRTLETWSDLCQAAERVAKEQWYGGGFIRRLQDDVVLQISYASYNDPQLDVGALTYSLAAALRSAAIKASDPITKKAVSIIVDNQRAGRWTQVQPIFATPQGSVHIPLVIEIANAFAAVLSRCADEGAWTSWMELDNTMDWVASTVNEVGKSRGWCSEHDYARDRIDLWVTAQMVQFLSVYKDMRGRLTTHSALERAGLLTTAPGTAGTTTWDELGSTDLNTRHRDQIKSRLRKYFVLPYKRDRVLKDSSVLLYGPPGTSKTSLMEGLADKLRWHFLPISPADFLSTGGEQVEARATIIFEILKRARNIVVLFDEVDELLLDRDAEERPQGIFRFMTTSMLPKLQALKKGKNVIFGIATNYAERLDKAIIRMGRVDQSWLVLPPDLTTRAVLTEKFLRRKRSDPADKQLNYTDIRPIAANTVCFSYQELKRAIDEGSPVSADSVLQTIPHPTITFEGYINRQGCGRELLSLIENQLDTQFDSSASPQVKHGIRGQLASLKSRVEAKQDFFAEPKLQQAIETRLTALTGEARHD
jgi:hypothetical protein